MRFFEHFDYLIIIAFIAAFILMLPEIKKEENAKHEIITSCAEKGGTIIDTDSGIICIKKEAIL
jgi:energy-converting hydrogenase Eha subunit A